MPTSFGDPQQLTHVNDILYLVHGSVNVFHNVYLICNKMKQPFDLYFFMSQQHIMFKMESVPSTVRYLGGCNKYDLFYDVCKSQS
jgi:hypothetical protein